MCTIQISMQGLDRFSEVLPDEVEHTELAVEDIVSRVLADLLGTILVDGVTIRFPPGARMGQQPCSIRIHVQYPGGSSLLLPQAVENMELAVEDAVSCVLVELFATVGVDEITINFPLCEQEDDGLPRSA